jgi:predicted nucleic acid-binding protein
VNANAEPPRYVLDSFALFAHFEDEAGGPAVRELLSQALRNEAVVYLSIINLGETAYVTERERGIPSVERMLAAIDQLPIHVVDAGRRQTLEAAHLKADHPIAYADAFALALAVELAATLVTGDPEFRSTEGVAPILWLPPS